MARFFRKHIWKFIAIGMILFGSLVAIPIGMPHQNDNTGLGWAFTGGIFMVAAGMFLMAAFIDRAIMRKRKQFYQGT